MTGFIAHLIVYAAVNGFLVAIWAITNDPSITPENIGEPGWVSRYDFWPIWPTTDRTPAWRWLVPRYRALIDASASTDSGRTLDGPLPKRPSTGSRCDGMRMSGVFTRVTIAGSPSPSESPGPRP